MAETAYNVAKEGFFNGEIDLVANDIRTLLLVGAVTIDPDHLTVAAVLAANTEAVEASYGRQTLATKVVTRNDTADRAEYSAATINYGALDNVTPTAMLVFKFITNDAASIPLSIHDTGFGSPANGAGYTIELPNGLLRLT